MVVELFPSRTIALELFGFSIYWYGIMYLLGFVLAWWLLPHMQKYRNLSLTSDDWSRIIGWAAIGVLIGGRLGYMLFYQPAMFFGNPLTFFAVRSGGMASHGGFIGVTLALLWVLRDRRDQLLRIADIAVVPIAIGLALGRIGNFINLEIYGTPTQLPWGIAIPGVPGLRHPTQLYAVVKNLCIAAACFLHLRSTAPQFVPGRTTALFLMLYAVLRFIVEIFRDQTGITMWGWLSEGQLLTLPVLLVGIVLWISVRRRED